MKGTTKHAPARGGGDAVLVWIDGVSKSHDGDRTLFEDVNCTVGRGEKMAVIGANGSEHTVLDAVVKADTQVGEAVRQYEEALVKSANEAPGSMKALELAMAKMDSLNGWELYAEARRVLEGLGCRDLDQRVQELSGGMRRRVALAAALLAQPDLLVLDEPTNHMDLETVQWLEQRLGIPNLSVLLVTHDRNFMEATCNRILELEGGTAFMHNFGGKGSYERFLEARNERRKQIEADAARAKNKLRKEAEWMRRMPKARQTKSRARIDRFYKLSERASRRATKDLSIQLDGAMTRQGTKVVLMDNACLEIGGKKVLDDFTYEFGKAGEMALDAGTRDVGDTITVEKDPVAPFVMYGAVYKKYWIEDVVNNKVAARRKGATAIACTGAVSEGNATSIDRAALPTVPNEAMPDAAACETREGITPDVACLAACDASCRASVESLVERQKLETGYALDQDDQNKVTRSCVRQCKYECTKPGQFSSFAAPFKR
eukprot:jgi/Pico_ML_1/52861/g3505.t3